MKGTTGCTLLLAALTANAAWAADVAPPTTVPAFNDAWAAATRALDNHAVLALWDDDGTSLLPDTPPIQGKPAFARFLADGSKQLGRARMQKFEMTCHDIRTAGDWAFEWCDEHQRISFADGRPPFEGYGRMLVVLHRGRDSAWRLHREMWQPTKAP